MRGCTKNRTHRLPRTASLRPASPPPRLWRTLAWTAATLAAAHGLHLLAAAPALTAWLYDVVDLPVSFAHHLAPALRWLGAVAAVAGVGTLIGHAARHLRRRVIAWRL